MSKHNDITGQPLSVGDRVAYATSQSNSVTMKIGIITELVNSVAYNGTVIPKIRVQVHTSSGYGKPKKPVLITNLSNVVKL